MLNKLKKLFFTKKIITESKNKELIDKISEIAYFENLEKILSDPIFKLLILNVYYTSFEELLFNLLSKESNIEISSINIKYYFKGIKDINYKFKRIIPILENNELNTKVKSDLLELIYSIKYFIELEKKNGK